MQPLSGSPLTRTYALDRGPRVQMRHARRSDAGAIRELLETGETSDAVLAPLLSFDPGRRLVLCATAPIDGHDALVGVGAIDLAEGSEPEIVAVDARRTDGLGELLACVLSSRAADRAHRAA